MGSVLLEQIKKQTATFLQEKYKSARITFTDVTKAELLAEQATNKDDCTLDAKTMTRIAEASFEIDDYWRIVDVLHRRLYNIDWEQWRQSYKALVLLEFMITHGPEEFAQEFQRHAEIIEELGSFTHIDERGFNWGARVQKLSDQILKLLQGGEPLREEGLKALKITNEIQGFGSSVNSSSSSSSPPCSSHGSSSFHSFSTTTTPSYFDSNKSSLQGGIGNNGNIVFRSKNVQHVDKNHLWGGTVVEERHVLIDSDEDEKVEKPKGFVSGICSKIIGNATIGGGSENIGFRCVSDVGRKLIKKKYDRQYSLWF